LNILAYNRGFEFLDIGYASAIMISISVVVSAGALTSAIALVLMHTLSE
jgi:ABC-type sugar transport system permease subunit